MGCGCNKNKIQSTPIKQVEKNIPVANQPTTNTPSKRVVVVRRRLPNN